MTDIGQELCNAIDIIVQKRLSGLQFDRTIQGTIIGFNESNPNAPAIAEYSVKFQDSIITAYATNPNIIYEKDTPVYITVPLNDFSQRKTIIGTAMGVNINSDTIQTWRGELTEEALNLKNIPEGGEEPISDFIGGPAYNWNGVDLLLMGHLGDLYVNTLTGETFVFILQGLSSGKSVYRWIPQIAAGESTVTIDLLSDVDIVSAENPIITDNEIRLYEGRKLVPASEIGNENYSFDSTNASLGVNINSGYITFDTTAWDKTPTTVLFSIVYKQNTYTKEYGVIAVSSGQSITAQYSSIQDHSLFNLDTNPDPDPWHAEYDSTPHGLNSLPDIYMRISEDNGFSYGTPFKIVGENGKDGDYYEFIFKAGGETLNTADYPVGDAHTTPPWDNNPPVLNEGQFLWMSKGLFRKNTDGTYKLHDGWSTPIKISGKDGKDGIPGLTAYLTNSNHDIITYGGTIDYTGATTEFHVFENGQDISDTWTYSVKTKSDNSITYVQTNNSFTINGIGVNIGYLDIQATKTNYDPIVLRFSLTKTAKTTVVNLTADKQAVNYALDGSRSPAQIVLTASAKGIITNPKYKFYINGVAPVQDTSYTSNTYTYSVPAQYFSTPISVKVEIYQSFTNGNLVDLLDEDTLSIVSTREATGTPGRKAVVTKSAAGYANNPSGFTVTAAGKIKRATFNTNTVHPVLPTGVAAWETGDMWIVTDFPYENTPGWKTYVFDDSISGDNTSIAKWVTSDSSTSVDGSIISADSIHGNQIIGSTVTVGGVDNTSSSVKINELGIMIGTGEEYSKIDKNSFKVVVGSIQALNIDPVGTSVPGTVAMENLSISETLNISGALNINNTLALPNVFTIGKISNNGLVPYIMVKTISNGMNIDFI